MGSPFLIKNPSCYSNGAAKRITMKGGICIPIYDFIIASFNIKPEEVDSLSPVRVGDTFHYHIKLKPKPQECPHCGGKVFGHGIKRKKVHHPHLIDFDGIIIHYARRYICRDCNKTFFEDSPFVFDNFTNSIALIRRVMIQLKSLDLTFKRIAELNHISTSTVISYLDSFVSLPKPALPESLGIDEIHSSLAKYGSSYLCVLVDNEMRKPVDILESRSKEFLNKHFDRYPKTERDKVMYVTIDMWEPYKDVANKQFKNAVVAVDPFHVVKAVCKVFTDIRIDIMNQTPKDSDAYYLLKHWHHLLEITNVDLDNTPVYNGHFRRKLNRRQLYDMLLNTSDKLRDAYYLKNNYQLFNSNATYDNCTVWLDHLIDDFSSTYMLEFHSFSNTLVNWRSEIINSFLRPHNNRKLSNAFSENMNSQIRTYLAITNGAQNFTRLRKRILYALNDKVFFSIIDRLRSDKVSRKKNN